MPYISQCLREDLQKHSCPGTAGELNYMFMSIALHYIRDEGLTYKNINDVMGALEGAKMEFYRRVAVPYEEKKIAENGDLDIPLALRENK